MKRIMAKMYEIEIEEILQKVVKVKADTLDEAISKVEDRYRKEEYILDYQDYKGTEFREFKDETIKEKKKSKKDKNTKN